MSLDSIDIINMGIKGLHTLLKKHAPDVYQPTHLATFAYKRVAIDISLYLYKYKAIAGSKWIDSFLYLICSLRQNNIHCVFVYDNIAPVEKKQEQQRRKDNRERQAERILTLEEELAAYRRDGTVGEQMREICIKEGVVSLLRKDMVRIDIGLIQARLTTMKQQMISITEGDIQLTQQLFDCLMIPYLLAPSEAEAYCSYLSIHGIVDGVLSEDTDVMAYGCPLFLTKIDTRNNTAVCIYHHDILEQLNLSAASFLDLCILLGTDYNTNIPSIGPEKSLVLINKHGTIEEILSTHPKLDASFSYARTRTLFSIPEKDKMPIQHLSYCGIPDFDKVATFFKRHGIAFPMEHLRRDIGPSEISFMDE